MNKCSLCTRPATVKTEKYDIVGVEYDTPVYYCDDHMFNVVTNGTDVFKITKEPIAVEKLILKGRNAYVR